MSNIYAYVYPEFYNTFKLYREYIGYSQPYSYRKWLRLRPEEQLAALYCQFYREITLAWSKVKTAWSIEEEGVECINQYLKKNVEIIKNDKKRFDPRYVYKVAYNCLYCLCIDPSKNKDRYYNESSATFTCGDDEVDWFDLIGESEDNVKVSNFGELQDKVEGLDDELQLYIAHMFGEITDYNLCRELKKKGYIKGNLKDLDYRSYVVSYLEKYGTIKLRAIFENDYDVYFECFA